MFLAESRPINADGVVDIQDDGKHVLRFERQLNHSIDRVWTALTTHAGLLAWWGDAEKLELVEGGQFIMRWLNKDKDGGQVVLHGKVTHIEPPSALEYDTDIHGLLRFDLVEQDGSTLLRFSSTIDVPAEVVPLILAGWHLHLNYLDAALHGEPTDLVDLPMSDWQRWHDQYQETMTRLDK